ncbi:SCO family protein [Aliikangiella coralliicola]|uniref:SCO family protein n=1 Tax=Aliikangiella coralliicola TaxID=2592383 RepID=A0A545UH73_9GAMM|nr:SCO family protein [Aliikangiella coralliicola]TQV88810.1 SCO family protein [Aliikangiella coralliicola]
MKHIIKAVLSGIFVAITLLGCSEKPKEYTQLLIYPNKKPLEQFELVQQDTQKFNVESFSGKWNLIFMGYTNCPDVCPLTLSDISRIYQKISPQLQKNLRIIFLSVDPVRDTPDHLAKYIDHFHSDFVGITGEKTQIDKLVYSLGGIYTINDEDEKFYSVDHSARIFIVNPKGQRFGIISSEAMHGKDKSVLVKELSWLAESEI